jgi:hypothetical protein
MKALTTEQSQILRKLINANWEADNTNNSYHDRDIARQEYYNLKRELIDSMGADAYNEFMEVGARMFALSQS